MSFSSQGRVRPIVEREVVQPKNIWRANAVHEGNTVEGLLEGGNGTTTYGYIKSGTILGLVAATGKMRPMAAAAITVEAAPVLTVDATAATGFFVGDTVEVVSADGLTSRGTAVITSITAGAITVDTVPAGTVVTDVLTLNGVDALGPMVGGDVTTATVRSGVIVSADIQVAAAIEGNASRAKIPNYSAELEASLNYGGGSLASGIRFFPIQA